MFLHHRWQIRFQMSPMQQLSIKKTICLKEHKGNKKGYIMSTCVKNKKFNVPILVTAQESEVLSIIRYMYTIGAPRRSLGNYKKTFFCSCPAIFEVPLYLIIDRTSDSCGHRHLFHSKNICPPPPSSSLLQGKHLPFPTSPQYFSLICDPFADPIISLHSRDISLYDCHI